MGNEFFINKSGIEDVREKFGPVPEAITTAENSASFEANYKEPEFSVVNGHIQGGDFSAKAALENLLSKVTTREEEEQPVIDPVVEANAAAMEPCC